MMGRGDAAGRADLADQIAPLVLDLRRPRLVKILDLTGPRRGISSCAIVVYEGAGLGCRVGVDVLR